MALRGLSASPGPWQTRVRNSPHPSPPITSLRQPPDRQHIARLFFAGGGVVSLVGALVFGLLPLALQPGTRTALVGGSVLLGAVFVLLLWQVASLPLAGAVRAAAWSASALTGLVALGLGSGVHSQVLACWPLLITVTAVLAGAGSAAALTAACAAMAAGLALNEAAQWLTAAGAPGGEGLLLPLATLALMLGASLVVGMLISRVVHRSLRQASEREQRFRELLDMSVDWYWELDQQLRFVQVEPSPGMTSGIAPDDHLGLAPWEISDFGLDEDEMDAHRADLEGREPFGRLLLRRADAQGQPRFFSTSGKPRFDADGAFRGYWGVGRDITAEVRAQQAVQASETRYRELFDRSPTPLVLHRGGRVLDANFAAATMCGVDSPDAMVGFDLLTLYRDEASRASALARLRQLERLAIGEGLPVADFVLHSPSGRQLAVQATAVRVMAEDGPATLSIYFDITARRATEALLSHVFATSPGFITLTEMASDRYVMVNPGFTSITGYAAGDVIGRTSGELGLWHDPSDRERLAAAVVQRGSVTGATPVIVTRSGALVSLRLSAARFEMSGQDYLVINAHDITETERARHEQAAILQSAPVGIAFVRKGRFQRVNPSWERMFGSAPGGLVGEPVDALWPDLPGDSDLRAALPREPGEEQAPGDSGPLEIEREMRRLDGSVFWCRLLGQAVNPTHPRDGGTLWIAEDITERRRMDQALAHALDQAEAASRAKSAFLANTSHEIRTPLNGLLGLARLAQQPALDATLRQQYLAQIVDSGQNLADVISDVLDLSKIAAGRFTLETAPFGLRELMHAAHRNHLARAHAKGLELTLVLADDAPDAVLGDPARTRQILVSFLDNAIKFTETGCVRMELGWGAQGRVRLSVTDSGPGIDAATQRRLFQPFSQADESTTRRYGGAGLGLSISRELATLMGGEVGVQSEPGRGSTFWAELPLPPASPSTQDLRHTEAGAKPLQGRHLLAVEDNPVNMMIAVALLEQWGARVDQALDGLEAIEAVDRAAGAGDPYDVVLMDLQMPGMGGNDATRALRQRYPAGTLPIIALTAAALASAREEALQAGMNDFVTKPIDAQRLLRALTAVL
jgi:PAS domain S-box-containing protein